MNNKITYIICIYTFSKIEYYISSAFLRYSSFIKMQL